MLFSLALLQILILDFCRQITADCNRGCVKVSICLKNGFLLQVCLWVEIQINLQMSWDLLRTGLAQERTALSLLCIMLGGHFYTNYFVLVP